MIDRSIKINSYVTQMKQKTDVKAFFDNQAAQTHVFKEQVNRQNREKK